MWSEFKEFALKGDVMDLAVGLVIGAAFGKIVNSLVVDIVMPPIGQTVVEFFIVAFAIFLVVRQVNRWRRAQPAK